MADLKKQHRYLLSILSGLLMVLSFPFTGSLTPIIFISWIPLLLIESVVTRKRYRSSKVFIHALITFLIYNIGTTWWIWNASAGGAIMAFTLNALFMAIAFSLFHLCKRKLGNSIGIISLFCIWIGYEYLHFNWELSWPWLAFGNTFSIVPSIVQWYSVTGVLGGTLWILLVNYSGFKLIENRFLLKEKSHDHKLFLAAWCLMIAVPVSISLIQYFSYKEKTDPIEVVVLQPNIDPYNEKFIASLGQQLNKLFDLADSKVTSKTDIVIAPETAISWGFYEEDLPHLDFFRYIKERKNKWGKVSLYTGASTARYFEKRNSRASRKLEDGPGFMESYNSSLLLDEENIYTFLHKSKLVLGVEKIPFSDWLPFLEELSINNGGTSGTLGIEKEPKVLSSNKLTFAPLICYESIYGEFNAEQCKKGAEVIFVITNDGWWGDTPGYKQHMSFSRIRAIENRRSVARSANTGISCFINQRGDVEQQSSWWKATALRGNLNKNKDLTFYSEHGDILGKTATIMGFILLIYSFLKGLKPYFKRN